MRSVLSGWWAPMVAVAVCTAPLAVAAAPVAVAAGETVTTIPIAPNANPEGIAVGPDGTAYSVNVAAATITRIPAGALLPQRNLPTAGVSPYSAVVDSAGRVFVTNRSSDTVARINPGAFAVPRLIPVGAEPWGITITPDDTVYATNISGDTIARIDAGSNIVNSTIPLLPGADPKDITYSTSDRRLYVANSGNSTVGRVNPLNGAVQYIPLPVGADPRGVAVAVDGSVYVADIGLDCVHWIRKGESSVAITTPFPVDTFPSDAAADPDGSVLVGLYGPGQLARFRAGRVVDTIDLGAGTGPDRVAVDRDGIAYTANFGGNSVSRVDPGPRPDPDPDPDPDPGPGPGPDPDPEAGQVTTRSAVKIRKRSAVLRARVTVGSQTERVRLRLARNPGLTKQVRVIKVRTIEAGAKLTVRKKVTRLKRHRTYWFRAEGVSAGARVNGSVKRLRTR